MGWGGIFQGNRGWSGAGGSGGAGSIDAVQYDDITIQTDVSTLNFEGSGVSVIADGANKATVTIPGVIETIQEGGAPINFSGPVNTLNFQGNNWTLLETSPGVVRILLEDYSDKIAAVGRAGEFSIANVGFIEFTGSAILPGSITNDGGSYGGGVKVTVSVVDEKIGDLYFEGGPVASDISLINFEGNGVAVADIGGGQAEITIENTEIAEIQQDDVTVAPNTSILNFEGAGVTVISDGLNKATVTIPGGAGSLPAYSNMMFSGEDLQVKNSTQEGDSNATLADGFAFNVKYHALRKANADDTVCVFWPVPIWADLSLPVRVRLLVYSTTIESTANVFKLAFMAALVNRPDDIPSIVPVEQTRLWQNQGHLNYGTAINGDVSPFTAAMEITPQGTFQDGCALLLRIRRLVADPQDTATQNLLIVGMELQFATDYTRAPATAPWSVL